jgi:hypothetical protein
MCYKNLAATLSSTKRLERYSHRISRRSDKAYAVCAQDFHRRYQKRWNADKMI